MLLPQTFVILAVVFSAEHGRTHAAAPSELPFGKREGVATALLDEADSAIGAGTEPHLVIGGRHLPFFENPSGIDDFGVPYQKCDVTKPPAEQAWMQGLDSSLERSMGERRMNLRVSLYRCYGLWHNAEIARLAEQYKDGGCSDKLPVVKRLESGFADSLGQLTTLFNYALFTGRLYFVTDPRDWAKHAIDVPFKWKWGDSKHLFCEAPAGFAQHKFIGDRLVDQSAKNFIGARVLQERAREEQQKIAQAYEAMPEADRGPRPHAGQWLNQTLGLSGAFSATTHLGAHDWIMNWLNACNPKDGFKCTQINSRRWLYSPNAQTQAIMAGVLDKIPTGDWLVGMHYRSYFVNVFIDKDDTTKQVPQFLDCYAAVLPPDVVKQKRGWLFVASDVPQTFEMAKERFGDRAVSTLGAGPLVHALDGFSVS